MQLWEGSGQTRQISATQFEQRTINKKLKIQILEEENAVSSRKLKIHYIEFFFKCHFCENHSEINEKTSFKLRNHAEKLKTQLFEEEKNAESTLKKCKFQNVECFWKGCVVKNKYSILRFVSMDENSSNFERENVLMNIFLYFDIWVA